MVTRNYQFYTVASQAQAISRRILVPGYIACIKWVVILNGTADNDSVQAELSFSGTSQMNTDDAQGVIDAVACYQNLVTSGLNFSAVNVHTPCYVPVQVGQIVYLNTNVTGAALIKALMSVVER